jgi:hypothetical protein
MIRLTSTSGTPASIRFSSLSGLTGIAQLVGDAQAGFMSMQVRSSTPAFFLMSGQCLFPGGVDATASSAFQAAPAGSIYANTLTCLSGVTASGGFLNGPLLFANNVVLSHPAVDGSLYRYSGDCYLGFDDNLYLRRSGDGAILHHFQNGNLGINKSSPSYQLDCSGTIAANNLRLGSFGPFKIAYGTGAGSGTQTGTVAFGMTFTATPSIICTINAASTTQVFSVTTTSITFSGFNFVKNYITNGGGLGGATSETFHWQAIGSG